MAAVILRACETPRALLELNTRSTSTCLLIYQYVQIHVYSMHSYVPVRVTLAELFYTKQKYFICYVSIFEYKKYAKNALLYV